MSANGWIDLEGAANARDVGGMPLDNGGVTRHGVLLRADNLQSLTRRDIRHLVDVRGLRTVIDLRTTPEVRLEGPGPLTREPAVTIEHRSLYPELGERTDVEVDATTVMPWTAFERHLPAPGESPTVRTYLGYLAHRPDSVLAAVQAVAYGDGAVLVHCAAGKDRTGVVVAVALDAVGVRRDAIVADYVRTAERIDAIIARLASSPTYGGDIHVDDPSAHAPRAPAMERVLELLAREHGDGAGWLRAHGASEADLTALRARLA